MAILRPQLEIVPEVIALAVCMPVAMLYPGQPLKLDHPWAAPGSQCDPLGGAVCFASRA